MRSLVVLEKLMMFGVFPLLLSQCEGINQYGRITLCGVVFQATVLLSHICKAGNGSIPKPPKQETPASTSKKEKDKVGSDKDIFHTYFQQDTKYVSVVWIH